MTAATIADALPDSVSNIAMGVMASAERPLTVREVHIRAGMWSLPALRAALLRLAAEGRMVVTREPGQRGLDRYRFSLPIGA
jgi:hypothetical protein